MVAQWLLVAPVTKGSFERSAAVLSQQPCINAEKWQHNCTS